MITNKSVAVAIAFLSLTSLSGCFATQAGGEQNGNGKKSEQRPATANQINSAKTTVDFQLAASQWQQTKSQHYEFTASQQCYCLPEARKPRIITVVNDRITAIRFKDNQVIDKNPPSILLKTIDQWFQFLQEQTQNTDSRISTKFLLDNGFPVRISVDRHPRMVDDEYTIEFSGFIDHTN